MLRKIFRWLLSWLSANRKKVLGFAGALGLGGAGIGIGNALKAKKINQQALLMQREALERHSREYDETTEQLAELGRSEMIVLDSFNHFADTIMQIQGRPEIKTNILSPVNLPNYSPEVIKLLPAKVQMALAGVGGAGVGALAGLAAFGAGTLVAAPAMAGAGFVLCLKGIGLKNKAVKNRRQAEELTKSVDEITAFYIELRKVVGSFRNSMEAVYDRYSENLKIIDGILECRSSWKEFSKTEKRIVENTILMARLLYEMTKTTIVVKQDKTDKLESINKAAIAGLQKNAEKLLAPNS